MLKDILSAIFSIFKSKRVTQADCQVYFDRIAGASVPCVGYNCKERY